MSSQIYRFGDYELDVPKHQLRRTQAVSDVEPQVFKLLRLLIENRDRVVTKEEIVDAIWDGRAISDSAITSRIRSARAAIGDNGREQRWIKTQHGVGFRFVGDVRLIVSDPALDPDESSLLAPVRLQQRPASPPASGSSKRRAGWAVAAGIAATVLVGVFVLQSQQGEAPAPVIEAVVAAPSLAILPFEDFTRSDQSAYLSQSIAERLSSRLATRPTLDVRSQRSASSVAARADLPTSEIGDILNVDYILEGGINLEGDRILLTTRFIDTKTDRVVWTREFDRAVDTASLISIETNLADAIAETLNLTQESNPVLEWETQSALAYEAMALGDHYAGKPRSPETFEAAIDAYTQAVEADPDLAAAYASRAAQYLHRFFIVQESDDIETVIEPATRDVEMAKSLDPDDIRTRFAEAFLLNTHERSTEEAAEKFRALIIDAPYFTQSYEWFGNATIYGDVPVGEGLAVIDQGLERDPLNPNLLSHKVLLLISQARFQEALTVSRRNYQWNPDETNVLRTHIFALESSGLNAEHYAALKREIALNTQDHTTTSAAMAWTYSIEGPDAAEALLETEIAQLIFTAFSGDRDGAVAIAARTENSMNGLLFLPYLEAFDALQGVLEPMGVLDAPAEMFALDRDNEAPIYSQEDFMNSLLLGMLLSGTDHPRREEFAERLYDDLAYLRTQDAMQPSLPFVAAGWLITEGHYDEAVDWLDLHSTEMRNPVVAFLELPLFDRIRDRSDFKRVQAQYQRNAADTLALYQADRDATR